MEENRRGAHHFILGMAPHRQAGKKQSDHPAVPLDYANVALPEPREYPGYDKFLPVKQEYRSDPLRHYHLMQAASRKPDQTSLELDITIAHTVKAVDQLLAEIRKQQPTLKKGTLTGRRIGQRSWLNAEKDHLYIPDGYCLIAASMIHPVGIMPGGKPGRAPLSPTEKRFLEDLILYTLDRLTALGFTSRPNTSASATARRQVTERIAAVEREKRKQPKVGG